MDGNSCGGETSEKEDKPEEGESKTGKSSEDVTEFAFGGTRLARPEQQDRQAGTSSGVVSDRVGSSIDGSGPSFGFPLPGTEENVPDMSTGSGKQVSVCPNPDSVQCQVVVRDTPVQSEPRRDSIGPPPSYSFVMNEKRKGRVMTETEDIIERPPPPSYAGLRGLYQPPSPLPSENEDNRLCLLLLQNQFGDLIPNLRSVQDVAS
ncbi:hypothetical protein RUM44_009638 [Polyplax serrata]|uniref:Uncharacterized protein n=1 Tax=Polyplax serrata TaxID=468196 RepID=A0ABR1ATC4_POLSC